MLEQYFKDSNACINYGHTKSTNPHSPDFHLHNFFEIYFFIGGSVKYFIEKKVYSLNYGDLLVMNSNEIHKPYFPTGGFYERIVIHFDPCLVEKFNAPGFDLLNCFINRPKGEKNKINLNKIQIEEIIKLFYKIENLNELDNDSHNILKIAGFLELLVYINKAYVNISQVDDISHVPAKLIPILDFIDENLEGDLTLGALEQHFFINGSYLCRLFKKSIGSSINEYIIYKRISKAKRLLSEGATALDACIFSGFNDYSNFARMFKQRVGVPPAKYRKNHVF